MREARPLPAASRLLPGVYYGWLVAVGTSLLSFVVVGVGFYGIAVFLDALCSERGWSRASVSFATTLYFVTSGLAGTLVGRLVDKRGPRGSILAGAVVMALALLWLGRVREPRDLYLVYPTLAIGFAMASAIPTSAILSRWFSARRALAMAVGQTGVSVGGVVLVPLATWLVVSEGLGAATSVLALLLVAIAIPVGVFVLRSDPREFGLEPDGVPASRDPGAAVASMDGRRWTARDALGTQTFWVLVISLGGILFCQVGVAMHQISLLRAHLSPETAALGVSTTALGSVVGRLAVGSFADRLDKRRLGIALICVQAAALATFSAAETPLALFGASFVFGSTIGNLFMLQPLLVAQFFGIASFGTVLGLVQLLTQTASGLGPYALGLLYDAFGGYAPGLRVLVVLALFSALVLSRVRPPRDA